MLPRLAAVGYAVGLTALALQATWPDSLRSSAIHMVSCVSLICLSRSVWLRTAGALNGGPYPLAPAAVSGGAYARQR
ncbi:hypothetical protein GCM10022206_54440 [Streptomyces chiangmaiensis]